MYTGVDRFVLYLSTDSFIQDAEQNVLLKYIVMVERLFRRTLRELSE